MKLAKKMSRVRPSATKEVAAKAAAIRASGTDLISLNQGETSFDSPEVSLVSAIRAIQAGHTRYGPVAGVTDLREVVSAWFTHEHRIPVDPGQVIVGCGAKHVIFTALMATLDVGDEVIVPTPSWGTYPEIVQLAGGRPVLAPCARDEGYKLKPEALERLITRRTRWVILNSPANPTGAVYSTNEIAGLAEVLRRFPNVSILSDEIYNAFVYDGMSAPSVGAVVPDLLERVLTVNGVSKSHAMTGWRVGFGAGPADLIAAMTTIQGQTISHTATISQYAALGAIAEGVQDLRRIVAAHEVNRAIATDHLGLVEGFDFDAPQGGFYLWVTCEGLIGARTESGDKLVSDVDVAQFLLEFAHVAVVPGSAFAAAIPSVRVSFVTEKMRLVEGCRRVAEAVSSLRL